MHCCMGMKLHGQFAKVPEVAHIPVLSFYPRGGKIELIFILRAAVSKIQDDFQNCPIFMILGHETWSLAKVSEVAHVPPF